MKSEFFSRSHVNLVFIFYISFAIYSLSPSIWLFFRTTHKHVRECVAQNISEIYKLYPMLCYNCNFEKMLDVYQDLYFLFNLFLRRVYIELTINSLLQKNNIFVRLDFN